MATTCTPLNLFYRPDSYEHVKGIVTTHREVNQGAWDYRKERDAMAQELAEIKRTLRKIVRPPSQAK